MGTTVYTYFHNDDGLEGSRKVFLDDCMCELYKINRDDANFFKAFNDALQNPALYVLLNEKQKKAYIGETDDFMKRISQHQLKKGFWNEVLVFMGANNNTLSKTEVQYLEYRAYERAKEVGSFDLSENTQCPKFPHMGLVQESKAEKFFNYVLMLSRFVGCKVFERLNGMPIYEGHQADDIKAKIEPVPISLSPKDLGGRISLSLNGKGSYSKRELVLAIVKKFLEEFPETTLDELKATFKQEFLGRFSQYPFIQDDVDSAKAWKELKEDHFHYFLNDVLRSGDGKDFVVCVEWDKNNIIKVLGIAKALGWTFEILKKK